MQVLQAKAIHSAVVMKKPVGTHLNGSSLAPAAISAQFQLGHPVKCSQSFYDFRSPVALVQTDFGVFLAGSGRYPAMYAHIGWSQEVGIRLCSSDLFCCVFSLIQVKC